MIKYTIVLLYFVISINLVRCDDNIFMTIEELPGPGSNTSVVGLPGPVGPLGLPGPKGPTGRIGTCQCEIERVYKQNDMMEKFKAFIPGNKAQRVEFDFRQDPDSCSVGIKTGRLNNSAMTASTAGGELYAAYRARLENVYDNQRNGGVWVPLKDRDENWLQIDLGKPTGVTGVITQGYQLGDLWVTSFKVSFSNQTSKINFIQEVDQDKIFAGNHDRGTYKINLFSEVITARYFRIYALTYKTYIALRMELLTC